MYEGGFEKNVAHGRGTMIFPNGQKYIGDFQNGVKHGYGTYIWWDGRRYEGEYQNGNRNGKVHNISAAAIICSGTLRNLLICLDLLFALIGNVLGYEW
jgi:hypothetical protein